MSVTEQLWGLGECCKLPQQGLGQSLHGNRIWCILAWKFDTWWHQFFIFPDFSKKIFPPDYSNSLTVSSFPGPVGTLCEKRAEKNCTQSVWRWQSPTHCAAAKSTSQPMMTMIMMMKMTTDFHRWLRTQLHSPTPSSTVYTCRHSSVCTCRHSSVYTCIHSSVYTCRHSSVCTCIHSSVYTCYTVVYTGVYIVVTISVIICDVHTNTANIVIDWTGGAIDPERWNLLMFFVHFSREEY